MTLLDVSLNLKYSKLVLFSTVLVASVHCWTVVGLCTLEIMFDFIDCSLSIVYLYYACSIRPEKMKHGIKLNKLHKTRQVKEKMREF